MSWTEERVEALKLHWAAGLSCSAIALELGEGLTRNAIIGKVHRLGLAGRMDKMKNQAEHKYKQKIAKEWQKHLKRLSPAEDLMDLKPEIVANPIGFAELEDCHCRWPVDGAGYQTLFCGADSVEKLPYCPRHCRMAYRPAQPPRARGELELHLRKLAKARAA